MIATTDSLVVGLLFQLVGSTIGCGSDEGAPELGGATPQPIIALLGSGKTLAASNGIQNVSLKSVPLKLDAPGILTSPL